MNSRLALGTVQFGLPYGIANRTGQVSLREAAAILTCARAGGVETLDTAIAYGESEQRLGEIGVGGWQVISKLPPVPESNPDVSRWVRTAVDDSLRRLRTTGLSTLLLHDSSQLRAAHGETLFAALVALKDAGKVQKIGVSIYDPEELSDLSPQFRIDVVQAPFNLLDRRLATSGWMARLKDAGIEIHTRSAFLQGLLLLSAADRPVGFDRWRRLWDQVDGWFAEQTSTRSQACLGHVLSQTEIDRVVVGVDTAKQLQEILMSLDRMVTAAPDRLTSDDPDLINPSRWSKT